MLTSRTPKALPVIFVDSALVDQRVRNFENTKRNVLSLNMGKEETRSIWYSIKHLEAIMRELYYLNADGVRIYLGAYESDHDKYPDQTCLLFVPTCINTLTGKHRDIILEQENNFTERERAEGYVNEESFKALNFGSLCKPDCDNHELYYPTEELQPSL